MMKGNYPMTVGKDIRHSKGDVTYPQVERLGVQWHNGGRVASKLEFLLGRIYRSRPLLVLRLLAMELRSLVHRMKVSLEKQLMSRGVRMDHPREGLYATQNHPAGSYIQAYSSYTTRLLEEHPSATLFDIQMSLQAWRAGEEFARHSFCSERSRASDMDSIGA